MRKKIIYIAAVSAAAVLALLIWRLDVPHWKKLDIARLKSMPSASEVYDAEGNAVGRLRGGENRRWISIDQVPETVQQAFIAAEDLRFYRHHGVDVYRMLGALWKDIRTFSYSQGASTITQQLIKLTHLSSEKRISRKIQEIALALRVEKVMSKQEILEAYLNALYFGHGAYGIEAAANTYFGKSASELDIAEGALLAGIIKAPSTYAPHLNAEKSAARRNAILKTMAEQGFISDEQCAAAQSASVMLAEDSGDDQKFAWYMDAVLTEAVAVAQVPADELLRGSYRIYTGLDTAMQAAAEALFDDEALFPPAANDGTPVQAALVALDTAAGEVRAVIGGRRHEVELGLNRATQSARQPGSAFKPISTYAAAIDAHGFVPSSTVEDTPRTFEGDYTPRNAGGHSYGTVTLREALSRSLNIATVDLASLIGVDELRAYAERFGIALSPRDNNLSLALGALTDGVSPMKLAAAYCALANGGGRVEPHFIRAIADADGRVVYQAQTNGFRAVRDSTAYMLTDMLKTAASTGSARALGGAGMPVAGKTGTVSDADGSTRDVWTAAYTPELAMAVWMGYDNPDAEHALSATEGGSGYPAKLCAAFLSAASSRLSGRDFARPTSVRTALVDALALEEKHLALLTTEKTPAEYSVRELFHASGMPTSYSDNWIAPSPIADFRLLTRPGETPVLAFTAMDSAAEYLLLRTTGGGTEQVALLRGSPGEEIRFADTGHDTAQPADYILVPRNALLYAEGLLLTGGQSQAVHYAPGGFLNLLMGAGTAEATPAPTDIEVSDNISLFEQDAS